MGDRLAVTHQLRVLELSWSVYLIMFSLFELVLTDLGECILLFHVICSLTYNVNYWSISSYEFSDE